MMEQKYTFEDDKLNREQVAHMIEDCIKHMQEKKPDRAVSFAINAKWGEGKSYFISMWKERIEMNEGNVTVYYNAWENDDCDSAILPLLYHIISIPNRTKSENFEKNAMFFLKTLGRNTLEYSIRRLTDRHLVYSELIFKSIDDLKDTDVKNIFDEYGEYYGKREKLQEGLKNLIPDNGYLWIFIDDLDRCNPKFAINTLECVKHFFDIKNIIFIFAIDYIQLTSFVGKVYGEGLDTDSYLKKFFDVIYQLPHFEMKRYVRCKIQDINDEGIRKYMNRDILEDCFSKLCFSLRDIDLVMTHCELFILRHKTELDKCADVNLALKIYFYFLSVKSKYNKEYVNMIHGHFLMSKHISGDLPVLDEKFIINNDIRSILDAISNRHAEKYSVDILKKYSLLETVPYLEKFCDHMEYVLM